MSYTDLYIRPHFEIPKWLYLTAIFAVISGTILFYFSSESLPTRASKMNLVRHEVVNVSSSQVGIYWETEDSDNGWILFGESKDTTNSVALNEIKGEPNGSRHYVTIKKLSPETKYFYKIISNNEIIQGTSGADFDFTTAPHKKSHNVSSPVYGKVFLPNNIPATNTQVFLYISQAHPLMAFSNSVGEWLIPLQSIVNKKTGEYLAITDETVVTLRFQHENLESVVKAIIFHTHPLPQPVVLGKNYTYLEKEQVLSARTIKPIEEDKAFSVKLNFPKNNAVIPGVVPIIKGKGIPNENVFIQINSIPRYTASSKVDSKGDWFIALARKFEPGKYELAMNTKNQFGKNISIKRSFTLIKSGEQVLGEASISATLTQTPTITLEPVRQTITPTIFVTETPEVTPEPPVSGSNYLPFFMTGAGLLFLGGGLFLLL